uniref:Uncharacterized protein n=1 Tax=Arundo donax TaxID=35708 RepID=A0A0A9FV17_ARUDO
MNRRRCASDVGEATLEDPVPACSGDPPVCFDCLLLLLFDRKPHHQPCLDAYQRRATTPSITRFSVYLRPQARMS